MTIKAISGGRNILVCSRREVTEACWLTNMVQDEVQPEDLEVVPLRDYVQEKSIAQVIRPAIYHVSNKLVMYKYKICMSFAAHRKTSF